MDGSDKDNLPAETLKRDETEHTEIEVCSEKEPMLDTPPVLPVKLQPKSHFEAKPELDTDNVGRESDEYLECPNTQDTGLTADNTKESSNSSTTTLPDNRNETTKVDIIKGVQSINLDETSKKNVSTIHDIEASSAFEQSENDKPKTENIDSKIFKIDGSSKNETQILTLPEKEATDENKHSEFEEIKGTFSKCKEVSLNTPITSPVKRKSLQIAEDKIKRNRSTDNVQIEIRNDEIVTESLNAHVATYIDPSERFSSSTVISVNTTAGGIKQAVAVKKTVQSAIESKITNTTGKIDSAGTSKCEVYSTPSTSKSSEHTQSVEALPQKEAVIRTRRKHKGVKLPLEDWENDPELIQNQKQILESISHQQQSLMSMKPESDDKEKLPKSLNKDPKLKTDSSGKDNLSVENLERDETEHLEIEETKSCPEKELIHDIQIKSPVKRKSESRCEIKAKRSTDVESDESLTEEDLEVPTEDSMALNTQIKSPVKRKSESCCEIKAKRSTDVEESDESLTEEDPEVPIENEVVGSESSFRRVIHDFVLEAGIDTLDLSECQYNYYKLNLMQMVQENPDILRDYPENVEPAVEEIVHERSLQEMPENERTQNPAALEDETTDSSLPENQPGTSSETDPSMIKDEPGLTEDLSKIKYEKHGEKFDKQNPMLPTDLTGYRASTSQMESNIDSEENLMQVIGNDPRIVSSTNKSIANETSEDPKILQGDLLKRKSPENKLSGTSVTASKDKSSCIEKKNQIEVKHEKLDKKHESQDRSPKKIQRIHIESLNRSKFESPKRNESKALPILEGLAARVVPTATLMPATEARPSQPPATEARPSQPPATEARPSQPPATEARPSQPPATEARPSQPPATEARPSQPE